MTIRLRTFAVLALAALLSAGPAKAQSAGGVVLHGPSTNAALPLVTPEAIAAAVNAAMASKADASGGVLTSPTVAGTLGLPSWTTSGRPTLGAGVVKVGWNTTLGAVDAWTGSAWVSAAGGLPLSGGTIAGDIAVTGNLSIGGVFSFGSLNITSTAGLQFGGETGLFVTTGAAKQKGVFLGPGAGDYFRTHNLATSFGMFAAGESSLQNLQTQGAEAVGVGQYSCWQVVTAFGITCLGQTVMAFETDPLDETFTGNDAARNVVGNVGSTGTGTATQTDGVGNTNTTDGALSLHGNSGSIAVTGTPAAGDVLRIGFATTNPNVTGLPATVTYVVPAGATIGSVAGGLVAAIGAQLTVGYILPDGSNILAVLTVGNFVTAQTAPISGGPAIVGLHFPGGSTAGWEITPSILACTGTCTEVLTVSQEFSGTDNIAEGSKALFGLGLTTGSFNHARGDDTLGLLGGSSSGVLCDGFEGSGSALTGGFSYLAGHVVAFNATSLFNDVIIAPQLQGPLGWTPTGDVILGSALGNSGCFGNQTGIVSVGFGDCPALNNWALSIQYGAIIGANNNKGGGGGGGGQVGIELTTPASLTSTFVIGDYGGAAAFGSHLGFQQTTPPAVTGCAGCSLDAQASDSVGTLTEGASQTGAVITFNKAFSHAPHCTVTSPTGQTYTTAASTATTLTLVNPSQTASQYTYHCI